MLKIAVYTVYKGSQLSVESVVASFVNYKEAVLCKKWLEKEDSMYIQDPEKIQYSFADKYFVNGDKEWYYTIKEVEKEVALSTFEEWHSRDNWCCM